MANECDTESPGVGMVALEHNGDIDGTQLGGRFNGLIRDKQAQRDCGSISRNSPWSYRFPGGSDFRAEVGPICMPISKQALNACESSRDIEIVPMDCIELERLIGDVCRSINHMKSGATQNQLLDLCDRLESAERYGDGMLDTG